MFNLKHTKTSLENQNDKKPLTKIAQVHKRKIFNEDIESNEANSVKESKSIDVEVFLISLFAMLAVICLLGICICLSLIFYYQGKIDVINDMRESSVFGKYTYEKNPIVVMVDLYGNSEDKEKYIGLELSPHGQKYNDHQNFLDIMEIVTELESRCESAFMFGSRFYVRPQCLNDMWKGHYLVEANIPNISNQIVFLKS